ncbi:MAG: DUF434 domain-containing protein [Methanotrichaceae archaeon]|nr:DUF434 domain-containing protein [Methanotrichaceae archaeon]
MFRHAAEDVRYLANRGFPKESAIRFVSDHYCLPQAQRHVLFRIIVPDEMAHLRRSKLQLLEEMRNRNVYVDGYNVLITVETLLAGKCLYMSDDGFLRDTQGLSRKYKVSEFTERSLFEILGILASVHPARVEILFDQQVSMSGQLAVGVHEIMAKRGLIGTARTVKDVDNQLKILDGVVATSDGSIIDCARRVVDLPAEVVRRRGLELLIIYD